MSWAKKIPPRKPQERFSRTRAGSSTPQMASLRNENLRTLWRMGRILNIKVDQTGLSKAPSPKLSIKSG